MEQVKTSPFYNIQMFLSIVCAFSSRPVSSSVTKKKSLMILTPGCRDEARIPGTKRF
jgi:hypothetical protein